VVVSSSLFAVVEPVVASDGVVAFDVSAAAVVALDVAAATVVAPKLSS